MSTVIANIGTSSRDSGDCPVKPTWLHVLTHLDPKYGGLSSAVPALGGAVAKTAHYSVTLAAFCREGEQVSSHVPEDVRVQFAPMARFGLARNSAAFRAFEQEVEDSEGVHVHGLWELSTSLACRTAKGAHKPLVVSAHGMLQSWALSNKRWKKLIYAALTERRNLSRAACLHALTTAEVEDYRRFGLKNPTVVIPNGVTVPKRSLPDLFFDSYPELRGKRLVLFLGRLHHKKGVHVLCEAWKAVNSRWPEAHLVLAGPDENDTRSQLETILRTSGASHSVTFTGMVNGALKWSALSAATAFILPSYSEGLSMSVLEALGMGVPVIVTKECNLPEVEESGCGLVVPKPEASAVASALSEMLGVTEAQLRSMSDNGHRLVARKYSWSAIGEQMAAVYAWVSGGPEPQNVEIHR